MRQRFVVSYDIGDPKRLRKVFQLLKGYGVHLQYSVFRCDLTPTMRVLLESELRDIIDFEEDRLLFVDVGPSEGRGLEVFYAVGKDAPDPDPFQGQARVV